MNVAPSNGIEIVTAGAVVSPVGVSNSATTNGESESTRAQIVLVLKSGAGESGGRIVRSTSMPPSPWRILRAANTAGSETVGTWMQTMIGGVYWAVVVISYAGSPGPSEYPPGSVPAVAGSISVTVVTPTCVTPVKLTGTGPAAILTFVPTGVKSDQMAGEPNSYAPMSEPSEAFKIEAKSKVRKEPRWSVARPKLLPLSMAGLPAKSACVSVGPPLF